MTIVNNSLNNTQKYKPEILIIKIMRLQYICVRYPVKSIKYDIELNLLVIFKL